MKRLLLLFCAIFIARVSQADVFGRMTFQNCYQGFVAPITGGTYNVIGGTNMVFGSTNPLDFSSFSIWDHTTNSFITTIGAGVPYPIVSGMVYEVFPVVTPGTFNPGGWGSVILNASAPTINLPDACMAFGQPIDFGIPFSGLCDWEMEIYNPHTNQTLLNYNTNGQFVIDPGDFCTPPLGEDWLHTLRCQSDILVTLRIRPCEYEDPNCPPITVSRLITVCCNNCQPYGFTPSERAGNTTGIHEADINTAIEVYPNPANTMFMVNATPGSKVTIYSINGQLIKSVNIETRYQRIEVGDLTEGVYILNLESNDGIINARKISIIR